MTSNATGMWTDRDSAVFTRSLTRCEEKFPNSPCLDRFMKTGEGRYQATCKDPYYFSWTTPEGYEPPFARRPAACYR